MPSSNPSSMRGAAATLAGLLMALAVGCATHTPSSNKTGETASSTAGQNTCPVGTWQVTPESLVKYVRLVDACPTATVASGSFLMTLDPPAGTRGLIDSDYHEAKGTLVYDALTDRCTHDDGGETTRTWNGAAHIIWSTSNALPGTRNLLMIAFTDGMGLGDVGTIHTVMKTPSAHVPNERGEDGVERPLTKDEPLSTMGFFMFNAGGQYQCNGDRLSLDFGVKYKALGETPPPPLEMVRVAAPR